MSDESTDSELIESLREIDNDDDIDVSRWEADFIDTVVYKQKTPLSSKQREIARRIIEEYL